MKLFSYASGKDIAKRLVKLHHEAQREGCDCVVDAIIADQHNRLLILRRSPDESFLPLCWDLPGGHVKPGETLGKALRREVMEEIGVPLGAIDSLIATWDWEKSRNGAIRKVRQFEFLASLRDPHSLFRLSPGEFVEWRWIAQQELSVFMENRNKDDTRMQDVLRHAFTLINQTK